MHFTPSDGGLPARLPLTVDFSTGFYFHREGPGLAFGGREQTLEEVALPAARRLPVLAELPVQSSWWGYYEVSPDHNAIVGEAEEPSRFLYATGFSGHGFQQAPAVGEHVAELVAGRDADARPLAVRARALRARRGAARGVRHLTRRTLIVNPNASRVTEERDRRGRGRLRPAETLRTERRGHATELAARGRGRRGLGARRRRRRQRGAERHPRRASRSASSLPAARTSSRALSEPGSAGSRSAASTAAGSRSRQASASTPRSSASWRPGNARRAAAAPAISSTGAPWRGGCSAAPNRGSRSWGRGAPPRSSSANDAVYTYAGPCRCASSPDARFELGLDFAAPVRVTPLSSRQLVHPRVGGPRDGRCIRRPQRPRPRPHRGSLRRPAAAPGGR